MQYHLRPESQILANSEEYTPRVARQACIKLTAIKMLVKVLAREDLRPESETQAKSNN
jgi:hypothetical protein